MKVCVCISHADMCSLDWCYRADHEKVCLTYVSCSGLFQVQQPILNNTADPHTHVACRSKNTISISTIQCVSSILHFRQNKALRAHAMAVILIQDPCKDFHVPEIFIKQATMVSSCSNVARAPTEICQIIILKLCVIQ